MPEIEYGKPYVIRLTAEDEAQLQDAVRASIARSDERQRVWQEFRRGLLTAGEFLATGGVLPVDEDEVGLIGEYRGDTAAAVGQRFYLTPCCGASAKGLEDCIGCRNCYAEVDPRLGGIPGSDGPSFYTFRLPS